MQLQSLPTYDDLFEPTLRALKALGGSGTVQQIYEKVCELEGYSEAQQSILHNQGPRTKTSYRLAWTRTYLKNYGVIENSERGLCSLTEKGRGLQVVDKAEIKRVSKSDQKADLPEPDQSKVDSSILAEFDLWS